MTDTINQTPAEKAEYLFDRFRNLSPYCYSPHNIKAMIKSAALIAVDEIIDAIPEGIVDGKYYSGDDLKYWEAVRETIKVL